MADVNNVNSTTMKLSALDFDNSFLNQLDDDCLLEIFSYLTLDDILHVERVCRRWKGLCENIWAEVKSLKFEYGQWYLMRRYFGREVYNTSSNPDLKKILRRSGKFIKYFDGSFNKCSELIIVTKFCKNLLEMVIDSYFSPLAIEIRSIAKNCKQLRSISLSNIEPKAEKDLSELLTNTKNLEYFSLDYRSGWRTTGEFLQYLPADIIGLELRNIALLELYFFIRAMKQFNNLRFFEYGPRVFLDNSMMEVINQKKTLIHLSLTGVQSKLLISFHYLGNLTNLEKLRLDHLDKFTDIDLMTISNNCKQLKSLQIYGCQSITNEGIASIAKLKQLKTLKMHELDNVTDEPIGDLPDSLEVLSCFLCPKVKNDGVTILIRKAANLKELDLYSCSITNDTIETAIEVTRKRTNGIVLEMCVGNTNADLLRIKKTSPFLKITT